MEKRSVKDNSFTDRFLSSFECFPIIFLPATASPSSRPSPWRRTSQSRFSCDIFSFPKRPEHYIMCLSTNFTRGRHYIMELRIADRQCRDQGGISAVSTIFSPSTRRRPPVSPVRTTGSGWRRRGRRDVYCCHHHQRRPHRRAAHPPGGQPGGPRRTVRRSFGLAVR